jgi:hypothetical protein
VVEESRTPGKVLSAFNATFLMLIPKEERVTHPKQYTPIALCNFIYKIITKVSVVCLKPILSYIISKDQAGYVEGRKIMDSFILAHEVIHSLKTTRTLDMLIKLDLSKSFDRINWKYMRSLLEAFGFNSLRVSWIMRLTSSDFFSILVNGVPSQPFSPSIGIRQGDHFSPFLFFIMVERPGCYLKASVVEGSLNGLPLHNIHSTPSHIQFVYDTLLMNTPITQEATKLTSILTDFTEASRMD